MDKLTKERRSANMARIRSEGSEPEMRVRSTAHHMGYRFRLHRKDLPGRPDLVFPKLHKIVLVHGCFWHQHPGCREGRIPSTNVDYWTAKLLRNCQRDQQVLGELKQLGWDVLVVWECETGDLGALGSSLTGFLSS